MSTNTHTIESQNYEGDTLRFIDYGKYGLTVETVYNGTSVDFGVYPDEIPALIEWLQAAQRNGAER